MKRTLIKNLTSTMQEQEVCIKGWLRTRRDSKGGFSFLEINDGSNQGGIQVIADNKLENYSDITQLYTGASVAIEGELKIAEGRKQAIEIHAHKVKIYGNTDNSYPLQKGRVSFEKLRDIAHLRPRTHTFGAVMRVRNALSYATHRFFQERDFHYLNSPIITASDCEGAGEMFQVTTLDLKNTPRLENGEIDYSKDFFNKQAHLTVSGQLNGEAYACALGNIYTFGPTFRAENSNTSRHLAEFWMVEPEMAFADLDDDVELAQDYLKHLIKTCLDECQDEVDFFNARIDKGIRQRLEGLVDTNFERITYTEAISILEKSGHKFQFPVSWGCDLQSEHERFLTEVIFKAPVTVVDYPKEIKAFYMKLNDDNKTVRAMDVLCPKIGEIIGGSQREDDLDGLTQRIKALGLEPSDYDWYLDLRRFGNVPHAGFGLGFERVVQFCTGMENIRDVIPFPRVPRNASF